MDVRERRIRDDESRLLCKELQSYFTSNQPTEDCKPGLRKVPNDRHQGCSGTYVVAGFADAANASQQAACRRSSNSTARYRGAKRPIKFTDETSLLYV